VERFDAVVVGAGPTGLACGIELKRRGVGASVHFIPLHEHPYYRDAFGYRPESLPTAHALYLRSVSLPFFSAMTDPQVERVIEVVSTLIGEHRR